MSNGTPERILDEAWALARRRGLAAVTMGEIAKAAGVSRQLMYFHFANRAGLLVAMTRRQDTRSGFRERAWATRELEPAAAFEALIRAWFEYLPEILPVTYALEAAALTGDDGANAWHDRMGELREAFRFATGRLAEAGALADGWTADTAADWAWARVQPSNWRHLVDERAWAGGDYLDRATASIRREIVAGNV
ncbi:MAG TPA: helix-turn-helix domain-containing protein [Solirubrobacteraceae bacterium]|nr:helix-turn-helix domain-containing protein [Solirubrobacteraceae bacterium]